MIVNEAKDLPQEPNGHRTEGLILQTLFYFSGKPSESTKKIAIALFHHQLEYITSYFS
jgi:hypothetical protein